MPVLAPREQADREAAAVTKAVLRAADRLEVKNSILGRIVGASEATISRMRNEGRLLRRDQKEFELGVLFVRLYRSLDAITGGDDHTASQWLRNENTALKAVPIAVVQEVQGLTDVIRYLDARRAII